MAGRKSLKHWQSFYNTIQDLQIKCSIRDDIITPEIAKYFEQTFFNDKLYLIAEKAMNSIGNKTEIELRGIDIDCRAFDLRFREIKARNKELLEAEGKVVWESLLREDGKLFSGIRTAEDSPNYAYCAYTNIESTFYGFYNRFKNLTKPAMLEPLTLEKLVKYGFDELMIERLFDLKTDYECKVANEQGHFFASNISDLIFSGEMGYDKFHNVGIDRFKTFDEMFERAVNVKSIVIKCNPDLSDSHKKAFYLIEQSLYNLKFNEWLRKSKNWDPENKTQYTEFLTKEVWIEFMIHQRNWEAEQLKRHEADLESWQIPDGVPNLIEDKIETPRREIIRERLAKYNFNQFLKSQNLANDRIAMYEDLLCTKELPYCMALLSGLGYLDYFKSEYCSGKAVQRDKLLAEVFETIPRRIKGNINVLNPNSSENQTNYTSYQYKESIDKLIKGR